jgi:hypothetical protein
LNWYLYKLNNIWHYRWSIEILLHPSLMVQQGVI